jgi:hypothetical protein
VAISYSKIFFFWYMLLGFVLLPIILIIIILPFEKRVPKLIGIVGASPLLWGLVFFTWLSIIDRPPSLVDDLSSGNLNYNKVLSIKFIRPSRGLLEKDVIYEIQSNKGAHNLFNELAQSLVNDLFEGNKHRNHPHTVCPDQKIKISLEDGSTYIIWFSVHHNWDGGNYDYSSLNISPLLPKPKDSREKLIRKWFGVGPIDKHYESKSFVCFIKKYDPWYPKQPG